MSSFKNTRNSVAHWCGLLRNKWINLKDWVIDNTLSVSEDIYRFLNAIYGAQPGTYWLILISGPVFILWGITLSSSGHGIMASAFISLGASITAIYWANALQKITTSIPREDWSRKIVGCNDELVAYLLKVKGLRIVFHSKTTYNRELKAVGIQEVYATQTNIRILEILLRKRNISFLVQLSPCQLKQIRKHLSTITSEIERVSQNYGRPMASREFNHDFANLLSSLQNGIHILESSEKGKLPPTNITKKRIGLLDRNKTRAKRSIKRDTSVYIRSEHKDLIQLNAKAFWTTVMLIQYLRSLITFTNVYSYSNNAAISVIKSRFLYILARFSQGAQRYQKTRKPYNNEK